MFGWPDPNTGFDQSARVIYMLFYNVASSLVMITNTSTNSKHCLITSVQKPIGGTADNTPRNKIRQLCALVKCLCVKIMQLYPNDQINRVDSSKSLGLIIEEDLTWEESY